MRLEDMTVLVTGAASGIGHALSHGFLDDGAVVVAVDRDREGLAPLEDRGAITHLVDVSDAMQVERMVMEAVDRTGHLDVLINNAGVAVRRKIVDHKPGEFENVIRINLFGPYYGLKYAIPVMREQGFGRIVNLVSRAAEAANINLSAYGSSKAALFALTRHAANETRNDEADILINGLIPGITKSGMMPQGQDPEVVYPSARRLATLPKGGPTGRVFWGDKEYYLFDPENEAFRR